MVETILMIDVDWMPKSWWASWVETREALLNKLGYTLNGVIRKPSPSGKGIHVWLYVEGPVLTDMQKLRLQYLSGDCIVRCKINHKRVLRGIRGFWNKLFYFKHRIRQLPKRCQKCRIGRAIQELETKDERWLKEVTKNANP